MKLLLIYKVGFPTVRESLTFRDKGTEVTVHKCVETIQGRKVFKGGNYMRKYGNLQKREPKMTITLPSRLCKLVLHLSYFLA